jgi:hypothetical protein
MRPLKLVIFLLLLITFSTQTFRHIYVRWIEPNKSVLDNYKENIDKDIDDTNNLDELVKLYDIAYDKVKEYEDNPNNKEIEYNEKHSTEPYKTKIKIENSIKKIERQNKKLFEFISYWFFGLLSLIIGISVYIKINKWIGIGSIIAGFTEMAFWTSPLFRSYGPQYAFDLLLNLKLFLSILSWALLIILWLINEKLTEK